MFSETRNIFIKREDTFSVRVPISNWSVIRLRLQTFFVIKNIKKEEKKCAYLLKGLSDSGLVFVMESCYPKSPLEKSIVELLGILEKCDNITALFRKQF